MRGTQTTEFGSEVKADMRLCEQVFPRRKSPAVRTWLAAVLAVATVGATPAAASDPYAQPGRLVRLADGRALNLVCSGRGSPTVILEAGFGAGAFAWGQVQPVVARR